MVPKDATLSTINSLLPRKLTWVFVPVAAATSSVPPVWSWKRPVLAGLTAVDAVSEPAMLSVPFSARLRRVRAGQRPGRPGIDRERLEMAERGAHSTDRAVPLPPASSSVFVPLLFALTLPTNTAPGSTTRRLVALAVKSTA